MNNNGPALLVAIVDDAAIVKVNGRANFTTSVTFKRLVGELQQRGYERFVLDLSDCVTMDSTFLGVLAGTALRMAEPSAVLNARASQQPLPTRTLCLVNPNQRVADLLDNLGVADLFETTRYEAPPEAQYQARVQEPTPSRAELSRTCLEAHRVLMALDPDNIPKFKEVTQFLAEDVKKLNGEGT